ncbi:hypothetical protein [Paenibacillus odorifer]|uniref:hypothetical protein n=1 Tax=Paenibacillus odorifer TaxID=189426 RepID=UPI0009D6EEEA|nr:hypothetical protein [Paenibacillus odorifer]
MTTKYEEVYDSFMQKISDYSFISLTNEQLDTFLKNLMKSAIVRFKKCKNELIVNDPIEFSSELTQEEIEIIALLMTVEWIRPRINNIELLKQSLNTKDWNFYSQANHLKELRTLKEETENEIDRLIVSYSYSNGCLKELR